MKCSVSGCKTMFNSLAHAKRHYNQYHSGEIETPEKYLNNGAESEQRDFAGEEPTTEGHNPEYVELNEPPETKRTTLFEHERENDSSITEYTDGGKGE